MVRITKPAAGHGRHRGTEDSSGASVVQAGRHRVVTDEDVAGAPELIADRRGRNLSLRDKDAIKPA